MRMIDADALIESLNKKHERFCEMCGDDNKDINYAHEYAVNMIGDAPTAEPTGDLISRADAIEAVHGACVYCDTCDLKDIGCSQIQALSALPPAEAVQGWIPCEERLPKPWESVMTTIRWVGDEYEDDYDIAVGFKKISGDWDLTLADGTEVIKGFLVTAWMPLPKPYRKDGEA